MKKFKLCLSSFMFFIFIFSAHSGFSYTAYFAVDSSINFSIVDGIDVAVNPLEGLTLDIFYTFESGGAVPGTDASIISPGLVITDWSGSLTYYGAYISTDLFVPLGVDDQLKPGIAFSLSSVDPFSVDRFELLSSAFGSDGTYASLSPYNILIESTPDSITYTASHVPIPPAFLLLGSGLIGMLGLRRRIKK